jgi:O-antigen/teichoic acid export membrane protein
VVLAPLLLRVVAPSTYGGTEAVIAIVAAATMPRAAYFAAVVSLLDRKRTRALASSSITAAVLNIGLNVALIPLVGITAAAVATLLAVMVQSALVIRATGKLLGSSMGLPRLVAVWAVTSGVLVGLAAIPVGEAGYALRAVLIAALLYVGLRGARVLHRVVTVPVDPPVSVSALG